jgi:hypothetical protein
MPVTLKQKPSTSSATVGIQRCEYCESAGVSIACVTCNEVALRIGFSGIFGRFEVGGRE